MIKKIANFITDVKLEFKKVTWPSREELATSTFVVLIATLLLSFVIGLFDLVFAKFVNLWIR